MRKKTIETAKQSEQSAQGWLNLAEIAEAEITSEDESHPLEAALAPGSETGWRAAQSGPQTIRLLFDEPLDLSQIRLEFKETQRARSQEFLLRWSADGQSYQEIVRQQYNFSPPGTTEQVESFTVNLKNVAALELQIIPDTSGGDAVASLAGLQVAAA